MSNYLESAMPGDNVLSLSTKDIYTVGETTITPDGKKTAKLFKLVLGKKGTEHELRFGGSPVTLWKKDFKLIKRRHDS
jgi:hypothetical protein